MKQVLGKLFEGNPKAQQFAAKLGTFPRFYRWTQENRGLDTVGGGQREKRNALFAQVVAELGLADLPITYAEFGVHKGESIAWWTAHNSAPESRFYGFDSFEGLAEDWNKHSKAGTFDVGGQVPDNPDPRVEFIKGWFRDTLPHRLAIFEPERRRVFHMDADLYRSTIYPLLLVGPYVRPGDIMIFDEFADSVHEFRAFEDFVQIFSLKPELVRATKGFVQAAFVFR